MGTTFTGLLLLDGSVALAHVGDSRAYLLRGRRLAQLTEDHSLAATYLQAGILKPEEVATWPLRHIITRAVGTADFVEVDRRMLAVEPGDTLLFASDGLHGVLGDDDIAAVLARERDLTRATAELVNRTNDAGGPDNVTGGRGPHRVGRSREAQGRKWIARAIRGKGMRREAGPGIGRDDPRWAALVSKKLSEADEVELRAEVAAPAALRVESAAATLAGQRALNADAHLTDEDAGFFGLSHGMGNVPRSREVALAALRLVRERVRSILDLVPARGADAQRGR